MNKQRLKWKIFAFLLGFCALLLVILWLFQAVLLDSMYKSIRTKELRQAIAMVEKEIDNPNLQAFLSELQTEKDIMIRPALDFTPPPMPEPHGGRNSRMPETITETKEFTLQNGQAMSLTFYAMLAPVNATVTTLRTQLFWITGIMLLLAVLLAILIAGWVSRPIETISKSALSLAKGDYTPRFAGKGFYEIVELSDTLNTAAVELGRVEGLRRELMANVSHDLRTPLSLIYSYAEMMQDFPGEITPEQTQVIMDETKRLTTLVNDVLDLSKLESDMEQLKISRFNLTQSIAETTGRIGELVKKDGFSIVFSHDVEAIVSADETKIDRAFYNLLTNAVNYSGDCREITVTQTITDGFVRISVTDGGEGITPEELPAIWDRYYKSGKTHKRAFTGTGLGLSIVKKVIEMHGGKYGVASEVGRGSTFWFEIAHFTERGISQ